MHPLREIDGPPDSSDIEAISRIESRLFDGRDRWASATTTVVRTDLIAGHGR